MRRILGALLALCGALASHTAQADCQLRISPPVNTGTGFLFTTTNDGTTGCNAFIGIPAGPSATTAAGTTLLPMFGSFLGEPQWVYINLGAEISVGPPGSSCGVAALPAGTDARICNAFLAPGASFEVRFFVAPDSESSAACLTAVAGETVGQSFEGPGIEFYSTIIAPATDTQPANNFEQICRTVAAGYPVIKTDNVDPVMQGSTFLYRIQVVNTYGVPTNSAVITDTLPAGMVPQSVTAGAFACSISGQTVTCIQNATIADHGGTDTIEITALATQVGTRTNTCSAAAGGSDTVGPTSGECVETTTVLGVSADLDCSKTDATDPVNAGAAITYNVACSNAGPNAGANVVFSDTLPAGTTFVSATGTGWTCGHAAGVVTCTRPSAAVGAQPGIVIVANAPAVGPVTNTCVVSSDATDPTPADPNCNEVTGITPIADLSIIKTDAADPVLVGGTVTYSLAVSNAGPSPAAAPRVVDTLPAGTTFVSASGTGWTCGHAAGVVTCDRAAPAAVGALPAISIAITAPAVVGTINNTATTSTTTTESTTANNTDAETTGVSGLVADLSCSKVDAVDPVGLNALITWTISCSNAGPDAAPNVVVLDTLPAGSVFVSATGTGWTCTEAAGVVSCSLAGVAPVGTLAPIQITANAPGVAGDVLNVCASSSAASDPVGAEPCDEVTTVNPPPPSTVVQVPALGSLGLLLLLLSVFAVAVPQVRRSAS